MTGIGLFLRSRRVGPAVICLLVTAFFARILRGQTFGIGSAQPLIVPWATLVPLIQAGVIAGTIASVQVAAEVTAVRVVQVVQLGTVALLTTVALVLNTWSAAGLTGPFTGSAFNRNLMGLLGMSLISARVLGVALLWVLPSLAMVTALALGGSSGGSRSWAWIVQPDSDRIALAIATGLLPAGIIAGWHIFDRRRVAWG